MTHADQTDMPDKIDKSINALSKLLGQVPEQVDMVDLSVIEDLHTAIYALNFLKESSIFLSMDIVCPECNCRIDNVSGYTLIDLRGIE